MTPTVLEFLKRSTAPTVVGISLALLVLVGYVDFLVGWQIDLLIVYLVPIGLAAWFVHWQAALGLSAAAVVIAFLVNVWAGQPYSGAGVPVWNSVAQASLFAAFSYLLFALNRAVQHQDRLGQTDSLTGLKRSELFYDLVDRQVKIAVRHDRPLTFAYIGVDNFNALNQQYGRQTGDDVLISIAQALRQNLRDTDILARVGGDEFAVFFPETGADHANDVVEKVLKNLGEATEGWPITFSIGAVVCDHATCTLDHLVRTAEGLMRAVKKSGVNNFELQILEPQSGSADTLQPPRP